MDPRERHAEGYSIVRFDGKVLKIKDLSIDELRLHLVRAIQVIDALNATNNWAASIVDRFNKGL